MSNLILLKYNSELYYYHDVIYNIDDSVADVRLLLAYGFCQLWGTGAIS